MLKKNLTYKIIKYENLIGYSALQNVDLWLKILRRNLHHALFQRPAHMLECF